MSDIPKLFSPEGSDELYNSETGEMVYSPKKTIWVDDQFDLIKQETYKKNAERDLHNYRKLKKYVDEFLLSGREIKINTPPPPSSDFLPNAFYRSPPEDLSKYSVFEDYIQKNMNRFNF